MRFSQFTNHKSSQLRTFEWFSRFKAGRASIKDDLHTGRPLSIRNPGNALKIKSSIKENPRITIRELSEDLTSELFKMLKQALKKYSLSQLRTFECFSRFKAGRASVKDDLHTGRPLSIRNPENALKIKSSIKENPRITIRELSEDLDISFGTYQTIIKNDMHLKRSPSEFDPHLLTN
ncbi:hypothetical protein LAZ67_15000368 [Cordylochernes scorpioides]|uniref:Transposase n=1 Tax=Cordylochernes scorpioides TaxID=51811 RepID=A0ABY6L806_9ARAC|nr:hypothetical protein LAZ67_15000368 [Cordylochernes scorpioides]